MNGKVSNRSLLKRIRLMITAGLVILAIAGPAGPLALPIVHGDATTPTTQVCLEGLLMATSPNKWLVNETAVLVDQQTIISTKRGVAEPGAWIIVDAQRLPEGQLHASFIYVDRPAGQPGPPIQISGVLQEQGPGRWKIANKSIIVDQNTRIEGMPRIGSLVRVTAERLGNELRAIRIETIAETPDQVPVEFEGVIQTINGALWNIDDLEVDTAHARVIGQPAPGKNAEVRATLTGAKRLIAQWVRITEEPKAVALGVFITEMGQEQMGSAIWNTLTTQGNPAADPQAATLHVNQQTLVDEREAVAQPGQWAKVLATTTDKQDEYQADLIRVRTVTQVAAAAAIEAAVTSPWSAPATIATSPSRLADPSVAYTADGMAHAVWEAGGEIFYAERAPGDGWGQATRLARGITPVLAADAGDNLHVLFANEIDGNYDIYYMARTNGAWWLPNNVSRTDRLSADPKLVIASNGVLHAAWVDNTPGYEIIYHGRFWDKVWSSMPVDGARGQGPDITVAPDGVVYLGWQDRRKNDDGSDGAFDIWVTEGEDNRWSFALNVSDTRGVDSLGISLALSANGMAQATWIEAGQAIHYSYGRDTQWSRTLLVSAATGAARRARIVVERGALLHVAWQDATTVRATYAPVASAIWPKAAVVGPLEGAVDDITLALVPAGGVAIAWVQTSGDGQRVSESLRPSPFSLRVWLPLTLAR